MKFINIYKIMIKNLKILQELINRNKTLKENCQCTSSELKERMDNSLAEVTFLKKWITSITK